MVLNELDGIVPMKSMKITPETTIPVCIKKKSPSGYRYLSSLSDHR